MNDPLIWSTLQTVSQGIERVFAEFDRTYDWNQAQYKSEQLQRPTDRTTGQPSPGLRDLYCYFIDMRFSILEAKAQAWAKEAKAKLGAYKKLAGPERDAYINGAMTTGPVTPSYLKFPVENKRWNKGSVAQNSRYGLWNSGDAGPW